MTDLTLRAAKEKVKERLKGDARLLGIGLGEHCIRVNWSEPVDEGFEAIFTEYAGWPVVFSHVGPSTAF